MDRASRSISLRRCCVEIRGTYTTLDPDGHDDWKIKSSARLSLSSFEKFFHPLDPFNDIAHFVNMGNLDVPRIRRVVDRSIIHFKDISRIEIATTRYPYIYIYIGMSCSGRKYFLRDIFVFARKFINIIRRKKRKEEKKGFLAFYYR